MLTTHVLDTARGRPAEGVEIAVVTKGGTLVPVVTDADGRAAWPLPEPLAPGAYTLEFTVGPYLEREHPGPAFFDVIAVRVVVTGERSIHVPLLLSPFGYSTYRGS